MSVPVDLGDLRDKVAEHGPVAFLVTVGDDGAPHVVSASVDLDGDVLRAGCGRTTGANATRSPSVTVLWPALAGAEYCLLVDGTAAVADGSIAVTPVRAVLHRVADAPGDGPTCVTVVDRRPGR